MPITEILIQEVRPNGEVTQTVWPLGAAEDVSAVLVSLYRDEKECVRAGILTEFALLPIVSDCDPETYSQPPTKNY